MVTAKKAVLPVHLLSRILRSKPARSAGHERARTIGKIEMHMGKSRKVKTGISALAAVLVMSATVAPFLAISVSAETAAPDTAANAGNDSLMSMYRPIDTQQVDLSTLRKAILKREADKVKAAPGSAGDGTAMPATQTAKSGFQTQFAPVDSEDATGHDATRRIVQSDVSGQGGLGGTGTHQVQESIPQNPEAPASASDLSASDLGASGFYATGSIPQTAAAPDGDAAPVISQSGPNDGQGVVMQTFQAPAAPAVGPQQTIGFVTTLGAVALALAATLVAIRVRRGAKRMVAAWRGRFAVIESKLDQAEAVLSAQSRLVVIWDEGSDSPEKGWGRPRVLGNSTTLATLLRYAVSAEGITPIEAILEGLSKQMVNPTMEASAGRAVELVSQDMGGTKSVDEKLPPLMEAVQDLRWNGTAFALTVTAFDGRIVEVSGYPAGGQAVVWISDITAQGTSSNAMRDKMLSMHRETEQLRQLINFAPFPVWRRDGQAQLAWVNKAYADAVEQPSPEDVVQNAVELDHAGKRLSDRARETGESCAEKHYVVIGGKRRALDIIEMPNEDGSMGMALDVTGVDQAERELKLHMDAHAETLDKMATAVAIFGSNKQLQFYNHAYAACWNLDPAWLDTAPSFGEIFDRLRTNRMLAEQVDFKAWKMQQENLFTEIKEQPDQLWHLPDGRHLRVVCQAHPMGGLLFFYEDVTDRFRLESSLNTLSKVQRATLDNLSEGVAVFGSDGCLELHNKSFEDIWQLSSERIKKKPHVRDFIDGCRRLFDDDTNWLSVGERMSGVREDRHMAHGRLERNDARFIDYAILPLPNGATLFTSLDVTDTTRITKALQERNEALEAADKLKSEFISHVSYQLRTPLTTIKGFSEMLDQGIVGSLSVRQKEYSDAILEASNHLMVLMDDILDLARIEAGVMSIEPTDVDVYQILESTSDLTRREAEEKNIKFRLDADKALGTIKADERRLRQIVFNLLSNAYTFTDDGGEIVLGAKRTGSQVEIWVEDTGLGIDPENQAIVFDRFESRTTAGRRRGAGLGLALVRSFVEMHGGWVSLESKPKQGTKVVCYFPTELGDLVVNKADDADDPLALLPPDTSFYQQQPPAAE